MVKSKQEDSQAAGSWCVWQGQEACGASSRAQRQTLIARKGSVLGYFSSAKRGAPAKSESAVAPAAAAAAKDDFQWRFSFDAAVQQAIRLRPTPAIYTLLCASRLQLRSALPLAAR